MQEVEATSHEGTGEKNVPGEGTAVAKALMWALPVVLIDTKKASAAGEAVMGTRRSRQPRTWASQAVLVVKNPPANARDAADAGSVSRLGRSPAIRKGNPIQYSCLDNLMDKGGLWATVHGVPKSQIRLHTAHRTVVGKFREVGNWVPFTLNDKERNCRILSEGITWHRLSFF